MFQFIVAMAFLAGCIFFLVAGPKMFQDILARIKKDPLEEAVLEEERNYAAGLVSLHESETNLNNLSREVKGQEEDVAQLTEACKTALALSQQERATKFGRQVLQAKQNLAMTKSLLEDATKRYEEMKSKIEDRQFKLQEVKRKRKELELRQKFDASQIGNGSLNEIMDELDKQLTKSNVREKLDDINTEAELGDQYKKVMEDDQVQDLLNSLNPKKSTLEEHLQEWDECPPKDARARE